MLNYICHDAMDIVLNVSQHAIGILGNYSADNHIAPKIIYICTECFFQLKRKNNFFAHCQSNLKTHEETKKTTTNNQT
ncbi:structural constituent of ribosome [Trichomonas vaginalis G3]|uniref:structural constituent of ribosome n=1 Tax=Trichomonas vaginalis (strain ATCC PRA-98 / G3) TaxID=412133 RepID=UPI0021E5A403|nr:structural constituent of ribosome [Trichomonas vaginalis G3]KAI5549559.1 structural constituent of ribosome [Trichomonas vaginalis G3]